MWLSCRDLERVPKKVTSPSYNKMRVLFLFYLLKIIAFVSAEQVFTVNITEARASLNKKEYTKALDLLQGVNSLNFRDFDISEELTVEGVLRDRSVWLGLVYLCFVCEM